MEEKIKAKDAALALIFILFLIGWISDQSAWLGAAGIATLLAMISHKPFIPFKKFWFGLSGVLGGFVSTILLSVLYYGMLTPIALLYRVFTKNPLGLKKGAASTFIEKRHLYSSADLMKPF